MALLLATPKTLRGAPGAAVAGGVGQFRGVNPGPGGRAGAVPRQLWNHIPFAKTPPPVKSSELKATTLAGSV